MESWRSSLDFFSSPVFAELETFVSEERRQGKSILPAARDVFNALKFTPVHAVKVVILGQDPYPNKRHAHGLAFSIPKETADIPKSLQNILKELKSDVGIQASSGNLTAWAKQGVLLLNTVLTVEEGKSHAHKSKGWEILTREMIQLINQECEHVVFILWGNHAQKMTKWISPEKHLILAAPHPSPLSSYRGFFGSKPFSQTNQYLIQHGKDPINWEIKESLTGKNDLLKYL